MRRIVQAAAVLFILSVVTSATAAGKIAVYDFKNVTPKNADAWAAIALPKLFANKIAQASGTDLMDLNKPEKMPATAPGDIDALIASGRASGVQIAIGGRVYYGSKEVRLVAVLADVAQGKLIAEKKAVGPPRQMMSLLTDLALQTLEALGVKPTEAEIARIRRTPTANIAALKQTAIGLTAQRASKIDEAIAAFRAALKADPQYADMHAALTECLIQQGKKDAAIAEGRVTVEAIPDDPALRAKFALLLVSTDHADEALTQIQAADRLRPGDFRVGLVKAHILSVLGDQTAALEICKQIISAPGFSVADVGWEVLLLPFAIRSDISPAPSTFAGRLPVDMIAKMAPSGGNIPSEMTFDVIRTLLNDQMCFIVGIEDQPAPDLGWITKRATLTIDDTQIVHPNLMGQILQALGEGKADDQPMICFDAVVDGKPLITEATKKITLEVDGLAGAKRRYTWAKPVQSEAAFRQLLDPFLAQIQTPAADTAGDPMALLGMAIFASARVDAHGEAPLVTFVTPPYLGEVIRALVKGQAVPEAQRPMIDGIIAQAEQNLYLVLLSPKLQGFEPRVLDAVAKAATISIDGGEPIASVAPDFTIGEEFVRGFSDNGKHKTKLVAFPMVNAKGEKLLAPGQKKLTLTIKDFAGIPERRFTWDLPLAIPDAMKKLLGNEK